MALLLPRVMCVDGRTALEGEEHFYISFICFASEHSQAVSTRLLAGDCLVVPHLEKGFPFHPTLEAQGHKSQRGSFIQTL